MMKDGKHNCVNAIFNAHIKQPIDRAFMAKVLTYVDHFVRKDENNLNFFGSNLIGVYPVKFIDEDKFDWLELVLQIDDYDKLKSDIYELPDIDKSWHIASDAINLSFLWVAYKALTSELLNEKDKVTLATASINMLQYKFISSIHTRNFPYPANISIALAVYEDMDQKSQLKRAGSWLALVDLRTADILGHDSLHHKIIRTLEPDVKLVAMLNDIWTRLKSIFKIMTASFYKIRDSNARITSTSKFTISEGEEILKDHVNHIFQIKERMHSLVPDVNSFVREDLLEIIPIAITTVYPVYLKTTLVYISENYKIPHKEVNIPNLIDDILIFVFNIIRKEKIPLKAIPDIAMKLKNAIKSSRLISSEYDVIKKSVDIIIEESNYKIPEGLIASTRMGVVLFIALRALIKN